LSSDTSIDFLPLKGGAIKLSKSHNVMKSLIAIIQLMFACITLYRTRGDQLDRFGYAAFGLTVTQYAVMSLVNLIANISTPDYSSLYMVRTEIMDEAERHKGLFVGAVAAVYRDRTVASLPDAAKPELDKETSPIPQNGIRGSNAD